MTIYLQTSWYIPKACKKAEIEKVYLDLSNCSYTMINIEYSNPNQSHSSPNNLFIFFYRITVTQQVKAILCGSVMFPASSTFFFPPSSIGNPVIYYS